MRYLRLLILLVLTVVCCGQVKTANSVDNNKLYIHKIPNEASIIKATNIIIDKLDKEKIYTKKEMLGVLNSGNFKDHSCKHESHTLIINFTMGEWSTKEKRYCVFSDTEELKGICLSGLYNGYHSIIIKSNSKIYNTAFAHELLHYFIRYIDGKVYKRHEPKEFWGNLVGYKVKNKIGILNEELKKVDL